MNRFRSHSDQPAWVRAREADVVVFNSTAAFVQITKLGIFFVTLGLPAAPADVAECSCLSPCIDFDRIEAPPSNPRRGRC